MGIAADFVLIVIAGLIGGLMARALRLPLLVGYVAAGVLVGPYTAGPTVVQVEDIERLAEIGVALLLFSLGLELSFRDLQAVRRIAIFGGTIQIVVTMAVTTLASVKLFGMPAAEAIWFGAMVSMSSTAIVLKTLSQAGVISTLASRIMVGLLMVQDLAVVALLIILPQLGSFNHVARRLLASIGIAALSLIATVLLGTRLLPGLLKRVLTWGSRELFLVSIVAIGVGMGYATQRIGLSFALGAFLAGLILSESEFSHQALSDVVPVRDIFGLLFFVTVGMLLDPNLILTSPMRISITVLSIFTVKALIVAAITRAFGYGNLAPLIVGLGLSQIGEFSFVLARTGVSLGLLSKATYDLALTCTVLTMAFSPLVSGVALPLGIRWRSLRAPVTRPALAEPPDTKLSGHIIVAGYGRGGRPVAHVLRDAGIPVLVVEVEHAIFRDLRAESFEGIWGDITREEILRAAHADRARILLITAPEPNTIRLCVQRAKRLNPTVVIIARAVRANQVSELNQWGVDVVVQAEFEGGIEMVRRALAQYQLSGEATAQLVSRIRTAFYGASL